MRIDYKRELEIAAKNMILVHHPDTLIKMIARMLVQKVKITHTAILLHNTDTDSYVLTVSRGSLGLKIPAGFARIDADNSIIKFFRNLSHRRLFKTEAIACHQIKNKIRIVKNRTLNKLLRDVSYQMQMFQAEVCLPTYFRDELTALVFLGRKKNKKKFLAEELDFFLALASDMAMAIRNAKLFQDLENQVNKNYRLFINTVMALAAAIDAKDHYTHGHTERVTSLSNQIACEMAQENSAVASSKFLEQLRVASLLHDIGKIGVPESILNKNGFLTPEERTVVQEHPKVGSSILAPITELENAIEAVKCHHEHYDGNGYPGKLKEDQIPLMASIISVADAFDAMITHRPYRRALSKDEAFQEIKRCSGSQFDPKVVQAFTTIYHKGGI
ncbi:MAG: HD domain-containing protein [Candidatus Omnitrophica bacterium]|jgi:HD-GYP domain-containing protein (c-di-GMP phosphodiesterase class II)|nr:HD domain-containing protein [Candidatus Omnitrophota bacterium]